MNMNTNTNMAGACEKPASMCSLGHAAPTRTQTGLGCRPVSLGLPQIPINANPYDAP